MAQCPSIYVLGSTCRPIKTLMVDFQKKVLIKRSSLFVTRPLISPKPYQNAGLVADATSAAMLIQDWD